MKLSELVEGWPEKKNFLEFPANSEYCSGYNQALTACDKEVIVDEFRIREIIAENSVEWITFDVRANIAKSIAQNIKGILKVIK